MEKLEQQIQIVIVAAMDEHRTIGVDGRMPWHLPADLRHFRRVTMGHPLVMGRRTHEAIGEPLEGRDNIVLTTRDDYTAEGCIVTHSLEEAFECAAEAKTGRAMVIGGEEVFRQVLPMADEMILTVVHRRYDGDTHFPGFVGSQWKVVDRRRHPADEDHQAAMTFVTLQTAVSDPRTVTGGGPGPLPDLLQQK